MPEAERCATDSAPAATADTATAEALAQIPDAWRGNPILVRCDGSGSSHAQVTYTDLDLVDNH